MVGAPGTYHWTAPKYGDSGPEGGATGGVWGGGRQEPPRRQLVLLVLNDSISSTKILPGGASVASRLQRQRGDYSGRVFSVFTHQIYIGISGEDGALAACISVRADAVIIIRTGISRYSSLSDEPPVLMTFYPPL